ncbi:MAG: 4Fe-4S dicluster domain-containing protein, partial [Chromatiaceae bacterium]
MRPEQLLDLADQCVKCGLCLPHCPTYSQLANEGDSPRGRIALIQGWASGQLPLTASLAAHLDRCLTCRACEGACPSLVAFGRLMDGSKAARIRQMPGWRRALRLARLRLLSSRGLTTPLVVLARLHLRLGLGQLATGARMARWPRIGPWVRLARVIPSTAGSVAPSTPRAPDLELFTGCMGGLAQGRAIAAARA